MTFTPVGATEIAQRLGIQPDTVKMWVRRHKDFPKGTQLARGKVWAWEDIEAWCAEHHRPSVVDTVWGERGPLTRAKTSDL